MLIDLFQGGVITHEYRKSRFQLSQTNPSEANISLLLQTSSSTTNLVALLYKACLTISLVASQPRLQ